MTRIAAARTAAALSSLWLIAELVRGGVPWTPAFFTALSFLWILRDRHPAWLVFFGSLAAYLSTFRWHGGDDIPNSLIPFALLRHGTFRLDPVLDPFLTGKTDFVTPFKGHLLSVYPVAPGILALPVYLIPVAAGAPVSEVFLHNLSKLSGSLITAASVAVFYLAVSKRCSRAWALNLAAVYALGSWAFSVSSQALWQHGAACLGIALGLFGLETAGFAGDLAAGFGLALAVAARPDSVFYFAAVGAFFLFQRPRRLAGFAAGAALPLGLLAAYWLYYTGRLKPPEYGLQQSMLVGFQLKAFVGLLLSPTRGLLFFFPIAAFGAWAGFRKKPNPAAPWLLAACVGTWLFISCYSAWIGGNTFGPRYFAAAALVLAYLCADLEKEIRSDARLLSIWCACVAISILIHALGGYMTWPGSNGNRYALAALWDWTLHPIADLLTSTGSLQALPAAARAAAVLIAVAFTGWLAGKSRRALSLVVMFAFVACLTKTGPATLQGLLDCQEAVKKKTPKKSLEGLEDFQKAELTDFLARRRKAASQDPAGAKLEDLKDKLGDPGEAQDLLSPGTRLTGEKMRKLKRAAGENEGAELDVPPDVKKFLLERGETTGSEQKPKPQADPVLSPR